MIFTHTLLLEDLNDYEATATWGADDNGRVWLVAVRLGAHTFSPFVAVRIMGIKDFNAAVARIQEWWLSEGWPDAQLAATMAE